MAHYLADTFCMRARVGDMTLILRAAGERTLPAATGLLRRLVERGGGDPYSQITVIHERPFAAAVRRTFELGLHAARPWLVAIDADVLLLEDALDRLTGLCTRAEPSVFKVGPLVLCKFHGGLCYRGVHCYPHALLERALARAVPDTLRPETAVAEAMARDGCPSFSPATVVGVHDFEQSFRHIYLKMRLRGRREVADERAGAPGASIADRIADMRARADRGDVDHLVALWGLSAGQADAAAHPDQPLYDWAGAYPEFEAALREHGIAEKPAWSSDARGYAESAMATHDFAGDVRTPAWVRERYGFQRGREHALARLGVVAPLAATIAAGSAA